MSGVVHSVCAVDSRQCLYGCSLEVYVACSPLQDPSLMHPDYFLRMAVGDWYLSGTR